MNKYQASLYYKKEENSDIEEAVLEIENESDDITLITNCAIAGFASLLGKVHEVFSFTYEKQYDNVEQTYGDLSSIIANAFIYGDDAPSFIVDVSFFVDLPLEGES